MNWSNRIYSLTYLRSTTLHGLIKDIGIRKLVAITQLLSCHSIYHFKLDFLFFYWKHVKIKESKQNAKDHISQKTWLLAPLNQILKKFFIEFYENFNLRILHKLTLRLHEAQWEAWEGLKIGKPELEYSRSGPSWNPWLVWKSGKINLKCRNVPFIHIYTLLVCLFVCIQ